MIPGPRPSDGLPRPLAGSGDPAEAPVDTELPPVALTRTPAGWVVCSAAGTQAVGASERPPPGPRS